MPINQSSKQYTTTYQGSSAPDKAGFITLMAGASLPQGWLYCDGAAVSRTTYSELFAAIGTTYGVGDGSTTFNLPSLSVVIDGVTRQYIIKPYSDITSAASVGLSNIGGAIFDTFGDFTNQGSAPASPLSGNTRVYFKTDGLLYKKTSGGVETEIGGGGGGLTTSLESASFAAVDSTHYLVDTSGGVITATLPTGSAGAVIRFSDDSRTWGTAALTIAPASGQAIDGFGNNVTLVCDITGAFVMLMWDGTKWCFDTNGYAASASGSYTVSVISGATTAVAGLHYLCNTTSSAFTLTLPTGVTGAKVKASDMARTWASNNLTVAPASGQSIDGLAANETLVCNLNAGWIELTYSGSSWVLDSNNFSSAFTTLYQPDIAAGLVPAAGTPGHTNGAAIAAGYVGELSPGGTLRSGTNGFTYSTRSTTPVSNSAYGSAVSLTLNKGIYFISGKCSCYSSAGVGSIYAVIHVGGTAVTDATHGYISTVNTGAAVISAPIIVTADSTTVAIFTKTDAAATPVGPTHEIFAVRIA